MMSQHDSLDVSCLVLVVQDDGGGVMVCSLGIHWPS